MKLNLSVWQIQTQPIFGGYLGLVRDTSTNRVIFLTDKPMSQKDARQCAANWLIHNKRIAIIKANLQP